MPKRLPHKTLTLMPYLNLRGSFKILGFDFVSIKDDISTYIKDPTLRAHVETICKMYRTSSGGNLNNVTLVSYSGSNFRSLQNKSLFLLNNIRSALVFAAFIKTNSWSITTADNFELFFQRFNVGNNSLALEGGSLHRILSGGLDIRTTIFPAPSYIVTSLNHSFESHVLSALIKCIEQSYVSANCSAVLRALQAFSAAYRNGHEIDNASRVLTLITAFEQLFGETGRSNFRKNILFYSDEINPQTRTYLEMYTIGQSNKSRPISISGTQVWAEEFYKLRNHIIHAGIVSFDDYAFKDLLTPTVFKNRNPHLAIGFEFFAVCLTNKLRELGLLHDYHLAVTEKHNYPRTDLNLMNINKREFTIADRGLDDRINAAMQTQS